MFACERNQQPPIWRLFYFQGHEMEFAFCYLDETGCLGTLPTATAAIQPVFVLTGLFVDEAKIRHMTTEFVRLKTRYYPEKFSRLTHHLESMRIEIKGADVKKALRGDKSKRARVGAERFMDEILALLKSVEARFVSRIWVKGIAQPFNGRSIYTVSTQHIARDFERHLISVGARGLIVADFRDPGLNTHVSHCIFSQKFKTSKQKNRRPSHACLVESPVFGISDNHAGLQIVDLITSALITPIATHTYCNGIVANPSVSTKDGVIKARYKKRIRELEFRSSANGQMKYGFSVADGHQGRGIEDFWK
ncbi:DUF3800 domain-containing protein [Pseudoxanthomonas mexicana]